MTTPTSPLRRPRSLFSLERMRSDKRVTWLTIVGLVLVPLVIGGLLVWALWNPTDRLGEVKAAVVNLDQPVTVNGQIVPLGRQMAAGLLGAKNENFTWVLTDQKDADSGIASGEYVAVVTIPKNFSKAATSTAGTSGAATQATIDVRTSQKSKLVDPAISQAVTTTATGVLNKQLTTTYLENVYVGFNTLHDQLAKAASGAGSLSTGLTQLASGTHQLADGATQLSTGADSLASGLGQLSGGASGLANGLGTLSSGTSGLANGLGTLSSGTSGLANGMSALQQKTASLPADTQQLADGAAGVSSGLSLAAGSAKTALATCVAAHGETDPTCEQIATTYGIMTTPQGKNPSLVDGAAALATGTKQLAAGTPALAGGIAQSASAAQQLAAGTAQSASGAQQLASGAAQSASGAQQLASGVQQSADGASQYATGVQQFAAGVPALASGADQSAAGAASLASGLNQAVAQLPSYDAGQRTNLASVASQPVGQKQSGTTAFGASSVPLFASVALWLGAFASFLVLQAISRRALLTSRAAGLIASDGLLPAAAIGVVQGVLVAAIMQPAMQLGVGAWFGFAGVAAAVAVCFAAVNHGLVALLGGLGRFLSMLVVVVTLASGIVSTAPGFFDSVTAWLPTSPAITALQGVVDGSTGVWRGLGGLLIWTAVGFALALAAVARRRIVTAAQLLPAE
ncbi:YhgE/Pip domain-containing protein [Leifsonia shinshuensis]|uniref:Putative membrane protein n=1 Tax=Leifsonia shinshuensis TaxID=150026 RepID=A0A853CZ95_9MICO|nr:YhgE/Pip domain-containing protein [Leifsonia shinshuensis]NYJ24494.1 putative membrane protein [Leifsonia shinshuensis]